jgi:hypothetical protein
MLMDDQKTLKTEKKKTKPKGKQNKYNQNTNDQSETIKVQRSK